MKTKEEEGSNSNHKSHEEGMNPSVAIMNKLPKDIMFDIWSRLPIESALTCRSVCKLWNILGHDSTFINLHLSKSMKQSPRRFVLAPPPPPMGSRECKDLWYNESSLLMLNGEEGDHWKTKQIPLMGFTDLKGNCIDIVGSCNGLLCIAARGGMGLIWLLNPITREKMMLPKSHLMLPYTYSTPLNTVGFGFDSLSNKYKVVRIYDEIFLGKGKRRYCEIITVGESSWRKLDFPSSLTGLNCFGTYPVFLNGTLYWLIDNSYSCSNGEFILGFDIDNEKFWDIECPPPRNDPRERNSLILMDGSLAIVDYPYKSPSSIDIWLVEGSMTMGFSFNLTSYDMPWPGVLHPGNFLVMAKFGHAHDDTFLLEVWRTLKSVAGSSPDCESCLLLYSPSKKKYLSVQGPWKSTKFPGHWFVPTLKSLKAVIDS